MSISKIIKLTYTAKENRLAESLLVVSVSAVLKRRQMFAELHFAPISTIMPISASELDDSKPGKEQSLDLPDIVEHGSHELLSRKEESESNNAESSNSEKDQFPDTKSNKGPIAPSGKVTEESTGKSSETEEKVMEDYKQKRKGIYYTHPNSLVGLAQLDAILPLSTSNSPISYKEKLTQAGLIKFQEFYSDTEEDQIIDTPKTYKLTIISMLTMILLLTGFLIPALYFSIRGSSLAFWNHFNSLSPIRKVTVTNDIINYPIALLSNNATTSAHEHIFKGVAYSPMVIQDGKCIYTVEKAIGEMVQLSLVTNKVRTYTTECNTVDYMVEAIERFNLDIKIALGIWLSSDEYENKIQIEEAKRVLRKNHPRHFDYILVGNEVLFRNDLSQGALIDHIKDLRTFLQSIEVAIPVGTSEISEWISKDLIQQAQVIGVNTHPFLTGLQPRDASRWVTESLVPSLNSLNEFNTLFIITEIGWPYDGDVSSLTEETLQVQEFMDAWVCHDSRPDDLLWYYFEAFDQPMMKRRFYGRDRQWEADWGIFGIDGKLKPGSTLPTCHN